MCLTSPIGRVVPGTAHKTAEEKQDHFGLWVSERTIVFMSDKQHPLFWSRLRLEMGSPFTREAYGVRDRVRVGLTQGLWDQG